MSQTSQLVVIDYRAMKPASGAARRLKLMKNTFHIKMAQGIFVPQACIQDDGKRPVYGFVDGYLEEIKAVLGPKRGSGVSPFTLEAVQKIKEINKRWAKTYPEMRDKVAGY